MVSRKITNDEGRDERVLPETSFSAELEQKRNEGDLTTNPTQQEKGFD